jgi:N-succinyldiaminopimelate aminotransferase
MKPPRSFFEDMPNTIFAVMSALSTKHKAINLGQGFPDTDGPEWIRKEAAHAILEGPNQYTTMFGVPELCRAIAEANKRFYGLDIDPANEVMVTSGATEALLDCFLGLLNEGDEAIVLEPFYDCYVPQIQMAGGIPKFVRLEAPEWKLNEATLRAAFSDKTKLIVLNTPMNPAAKVFTRDELTMIASLLIEFDAYAICDEVYEHLLFDNREHIPLMSLPGMRERCVRIGSAGKTFSLTGWKIGYITASPNLLKPIASAHQFVTFTTVPALQLAVAKGLRADDNYFESLVLQMDKGRKTLSEGLARVGFDVLPCEGTYFLTVDFAPLDFEGTDHEFCEWITEHAGVSAIPMSPFYAPQNGAPPRSLIRFCFAKKQDVLEEAIKRLDACFKTKS